MIKAVSAETTLFALHIVMKALTITIAASRFKTTTPLINYLDAIIFFVIKLQYKGPIPVLFFPKSLHPLFVAFMVFAVGTSTPLPTQSVFSITLTVQFDAVRVFAVASHLSFSSSAILSLPAF